MENEKCLIVHEYKIRVNNEYFMCLLVGNKEKAEYLMNRVFSYDIYICYSQMTIMNNYSTYYDYFS